MKNSSEKESWVKGVLLDKCPNCGKGYVFNTETKWFQLPVMNESCSECTYRFDREPGYFLGAMYLSYAFAVLQGILAYLFCAFFFPDASVFVYILAVFSVILLFGRKNYKMSRILYIHIFPW